MKNTILITIYCLSALVFTNQRYESANGYSFEVPADFKKQTPKRQSTDFSLMDSEKHLFVLQTFNRTPAEKGMDAHDLTKEMLEAGYQANDSHTLIYHAEKVIIAGQKGFILYYSDSRSPSKCEITIYKGAKVHLFALYTQKNGMEERVSIEDKFQAFLKTLKFKS